ncbi:hypothetical protein Purlil1_94 [Purpureocillium lilacinum]|uniref:Uncharacterized protein n=1 Tax=Purpureocillium lilacinum TaxID=33203 RepID=A0ABR0CI21_PURLI|nr:hypothetical protein Purlil1_94 [Purpureocillium lilacinum]
MPPRLAGARGGGRSPTVDTDRRTGSGALTPEARNVMSVIPVEHPAMQRPARRAPDSRLDSPCRLDANDARRCRLASRSSSSPALQP